MSRSRKTPETLSHGRYTTYNNHKCRCVPCTEAWRVYQRERRAKNPEAVLAASRRYEARRNRAGDASYQRKRRYGLDESVFQEMLSIQKGVCAVCGGPFGAKGPHVDHDHKTGEIRGLLCVTCNCGIGYLRDDAELVAAALAYLTASTSIFRRALTEAEIEQVALEMGAAS